MKCDICSKKIEMTFMNKILGTYYMTGKKKKAICPECQKKYSTKELREKLS
jgi:hypothetical protein